jgi:XTP/dITP diphosphohydrolase
VIDAPRGDGGFGYDPYFLLPDLGKTAAELSKAEKNSVSHRAQALAQLVERLRLFENT